MAVHPGRPRLSRRQTAGDFVASVWPVLRRLEGHFTHGVHSRRRSDTIVAGRRSTRWWWSVGDGEIFLGSDVAAFIEFTRDAVGLGQDQAVVITTDVPDHRLRRQRQDRECS